MTTKKTKAKDFLNELLGSVSFGEMLLSIRQSKKITQVDFAEKLGISKQDLCNIEKGRKLVSVERATSFAKALKMSKKVFAKYALQDQLHKAGIKGEVQISGVA